MFKFKNQIIEEINSIKQAGAYKQEMEVFGRQGVHIEIEGKEYLNFCSNNYLGLAGSQLMVDVAKEGLEKFGFGMASVRFICGTSEIHGSLEKEVSRFFETEDTILYSSCFDANTGLFEIILNAEDAVISDELNHASIIDGIRLCKAERFRYAHSNMEDLELRLKETFGKRRRVIVTDGVFSMDGEIARLKEIADLAEKYEALLVVDESHDAGVVGERGRGSVEVCGVMGRVDLIIGTFGKAFGGASGGFTSGRKEIIELLRQRSRTNLFSNALSPSIAYATAWVFKNFKKEILPLRGKLMENVRQVRKGLIDMGFVVGGDGSHPITPVMFFEEHKSGFVAEELFKMGIYVRSFTYPVVPKGKARIRVQLSAGHSPEDIEKLLVAFGKVGKLVN